MPFRLTNVPTTFQSLMNEVFWPFLRKIVLAFLYDILIYNEDEESHQQYVKQVLEVLDQHKLYANLKKCEFRKTQVACFRHIISALGVAFDMEKVKAMME